MQITIIKIQTINNMKILKIDFFKLALIILISIGVFILYGYGKNGRYQLSTDGELIIDTKSGVVYLIPDYDSYNKDAKVLSKALKNTEIASH